MGVCAEGHPDAGGCERGPQGRLPVGISSLGDQPLVVRGYPLLTARLVPDRAPSVFELRMTYRTGTALLPRLMEMCTRRGFRILQVKVDRLPGSTDPAARVLLELEGTSDTGRLTSELFENEGVLDVEMTAATDDE
ncbi:hypothetical protein ACU639_17415 [Streptomyces cynarae]|uniref:hypothetical protein n=1 Tax=Streptomyces cynarae TaxID=2981134 RepID=UPI00406BE1E9